MTTEEKVMIGVALAALLAVVAFSQFPPSGVYKPGEDVEAENMSDIYMSNTPQTADMTAGPAYLMYNQPWAFAPPVANILPTRSMGQIGQTTQPDSTSYDANTFTDVCGGRC